MEELQLNGNTYSVGRFKLRQWLEFDRLVKQTQTAVTDHNIGLYAHSMAQVVATAVLSSLQEVIEAPWFELTEAYSKLLDLNRPWNIPMVQNSHTEQKPVGWEYPGRDWFWWFNLFARHYGWHRELIEDLDIDEAISLLQEILVDEQMEKEWQWSLSEIAYPYNDATKKSVFKPLERPEWMQPAANLKLMQKTRLRKSMMPVGKIVGEDGNERLVH
jgi:hypothetical protein